MNLGLLVLLGLLLADLGGHLVTVGDLPWPADSRSPRPRDRLEAFLARLEDFGEPELKLALATSLQGSLPALRERWWIRPRSREALARLWARSAAETAAACVGELRSAVEAMDPERLVETRRKVEATARRLTGDEATRDLGERVLALVRGIDEADLGFMALAGLVERSRIPFRTEQAEFEAMALRAAGKSPPPAPRDEAAEPFEGDGPVSILVRWEGPGPLRVTLDGETTEVPSAGHRVLETEPGRHALTATGKGIEEGFPVRLTRSTKYAWLPGGRGGLRRVFQQYSSGGFGGGSGVSEYFWGRSFGPLHWDFLPEQKFPDTVTEHGWGFTPTLASRSRVEVLRADEVEVLDTAWKKLVAGQPFRSPRLDRVACEALVLRLLRTSDPAPGLPHVPIDLAREAEVCELLLARWPERPVPGTEALLAAIVAEGPYHRLRCEAGWRLSLLGAAEAKRRLEERSGAIAKDRTLEPEDAVLLLAMNQLSKRSQEVLGLACSAPGDVLSQLAGVPFAVRRAVLERLSGLGRPECTSPDPEGRGQHLALAVSLARTFAPFDPAGLEILLAEPSPLHQPAVADLVIELGTGGVR